MRRIAALLLALLACIWAVVPAAAESELPPAEAKTESAAEGDSLLPMTIEWESSLTTPPLYGSIKFGEGQMPPSANEVELDCRISKDGETDQAVGGFCDWVAKGDALNCYLVPTCPVFSDYMAGDIDTFYLTITIVYKDGSPTRQTVTARWNRPTEENTGLSSMEEDGLCVQGNYPLRLYALDWATRPPVEYGQIHCTATAGEESSVLPDTVPVTLQLQKGSAAKGSAVEVSYAVAWAGEPTQMADGSLRYQAETLTPPNQPTSLLAGQKRYQLPEKDYADYPDMSAYPIYCTVHPVARGQASELKLSVDAKGGNLRATLPLKPTGAMMIQVETSQDGGTTWASPGPLGGISLTDDPVDAILNQAEYTVSILTADAVAELTEAGESGFLTRLKIFGGPLGNGASMGRLTYTYSQSAAWPTDYEYQPPKPPSDGNGGEGNQGNTGTDNSGTGGVRPGTGGDSDTDDDSGSETRPGTGSGNSEGGDGGGSNAPSDGNVFGGEENPPIAAEEQETAAPVQAEMIQVTVPEPQKPAPQETLPQNAETQELHGEEATQPQGSDFQTAEPQEAPGMPKSPEQEDTPSAETAPERTEEEAVSTQAERSRRQTQILMTTGISTVAVCAAGAAGIKSGFLAKLLARLVKRP